MYSCVNFTQNILQFKYFIISLQCITYTRANSSTSKLNFQLSTKKCIPTNIHIQPLQRIA